MNIIDFGAKGDGVTNDSPAIQKALDKRGSIEIPKGKYIIMDTLKIHSDTELICHKDALLFLGDKAQKTAEDFLIKNADEENGNENITIIGGIWDGNCRNNVRSRDMYAPNAHSGAIMHLSNVKNITLKDMTFRDSECYYTRFVYAENVHIENILFASKTIRANQDGIHLAGYCKNFTIKKLRGTKNSPNDDFVALNADDCMKRLQNAKLCVGPIENIVIEDLYSPKCLTFVRILSVDSPIRNINIKKLRGSCKVNIINMDASKYCRSPQVTKDEPRYYTGVGSIENVSISDVKVSNTLCNKALILCESNLHNFTLSDFENTARFAISPTILIQNVQPFAVSGDANITNTTNFIHKNKKIKTMKFDTIG